METPENTEKEKAPETPEPAHEFIFVDVEGNKLTVTKEGVAYAVDLSKDGDEAAPCPYTQFGVMVNKGIICYCETADKAKFVASAHNAAEVATEALVIGKKLVGTVMKENEKLFRRNTVLEERNFVSKMNCFMFAFISAVLFFLGIGMYRAAHATPQREATAKLIEALHDFKSSHDMTFTENVFN